MPLDFDLTAEEYAAIIATDQLAFTEHAFSIVSPGDEYIPNWHVDCIIEHLKAVEEGEIKRLIVNMPPRELKSISIAIAWPAWLLGHDPTRRIICGSYSSKLALRHSADTRLIMNDPIYLDAFQDTRITRDQNQKEFFQTTKRGFRKSVSVGGSVLGDGGDYLILDDPVKADEALSETVRESTNDWIDQSFLTRQNTPGESRIVLVMQRLHEDDPAGHLMERHGWHELILPAEFKKKTIIEIHGRRWEKDEGDLLNPARLSHEVLEQKLIDLGAYGYAGQYMQSPAPIGGGEFKRHWILHYNNLSPEFTAKGMNVFIMVDPASGKKYKSDKAKGYKEIEHDYTAMMVVGLHTDRNYYLLDMVRDRLNPTQRIDTLIKLHMKWNKLSGKPPRVVYEDYGMQSDSYYINKAMNDMNYRFHFTPVGGRMMKEDRIRRLIPLFENRRIFLPRRAFYTTVEGERIELVTELIENEMLSFPVGRHDDMLDAFARLLDDDVHANFPTTSLKPMMVGETYRDELWGADYDEDNFMTW